MRPPSTRSSSGRVIVALLGLFFLKALGDLAGGAGHTRGRSAEAFGDLGSEGPDATSPAPAPRASTHSKPAVPANTPFESCGTSAPR